MAFNITKDVPLDKFGWEGCKLTFNSITYGEMKDWQAKVQQSGQDTKVANEIVDLLLTKFVSGTAMNDGKKVEVTKDDFEELPFEVILEASSKIAGSDVDPNS